MANNQVNIQVNAIANFAQAKAQVDALKASIVELQKIPLIGSQGQDMTKNLKIAQDQLSKMILATRSFSMESVRMADNVEKTAQAIEKSQLKFHDYLNIYKQNAKGVHNILDDIATQQARVSKSFVIPDMLKPGYAHVITNLSANLKDLGAEAEAAAIKQKLWNTVLRDGANQAINFGKNTQWAGRQLTVGLTVPLMALGAAASKAFGDVDQQLTRMVKVYGDGLTVASKQTLDAIRKQTILLAQDLAKTYGMAAQQTAATAADLAATGLQGNDLLNATRETMRLATLGELDQQQAIKATIALQRTFKLSSKELSDAINYLNAVENQTSTSLQDIVDALPRASTVVQELGGSYKDVAAMMVAMREAGVPAAEAANSIKSAMASLISPSKKAREDLNAFGIDIKKIVDSNAGNLIATITALQQALDSLDPLNKSRMIEELFGKFQFAKVTALIDNLNKAGSQSQKAFQLAYASSSQLGKLAEQELKQQTESISGRWKKTVETLKANFLPIGQQVMKFGTLILDVFNKILDAINKLGPLKNVIAGVLGFVGLTGPLVMFTGIFVNFVAQIFKATTYFRMFLKGLKETGTIRGGFQGLTKFFEMVDKNSLAAQASLDAVTASTEETAQAFNNLAVQVEKFARSINAISGQKLLPFDLTGAAREIGSLSATDYERSLEINPYWSQRKVAGVERPHMFAASRLQQEYALNRDAYPNLREIESKNTPGQFGNWMQQGVSSQMVYSSKGAAAQLQRAYSTEDVVYGGPTGLTKEQVYEREMKRLVDLHDRIISGALSSEDKKIQAELTKAGEQLNSVLGAEEFGNKILSPEQMQQLSKIIDQVTFSWETFTNAQIEHLTNMNTLLYASEENIQMLNSDLGTIYKNENLTMADRTAALKQAWINYQERLMTEIGQDTAILNELASFRSSATSAIGGASSAGLSSLAGAEIQAGIINAAQKRGGPIASYLRQYSSRDSGVIPQSLINLGTVAERFNLFGGSMQGFADGGSVRDFRNPRDTVAGGHITGSGGPKDDRIPAMLSHGEYVVQASAVKKIGKDNLDAINAGRFAEGGIARFNGGGTTKRRSAVMFPELPIERSHFYPNNKGGMMYLTAAANRDMKSDGPGITGQGIIDSIKEVWQVVHPMSIVAGLMSDMGIAPDIIKEKSNQFLLQLINSLESQKDKIFGGPGNPHAFENLAYGIAQSVFQGIDIQNNGVEIRSPGQKNGIRIKNFHDALDLVDIEKTTSGYQYNNRLYVNGRAMNKGWYSTGGGMSSGTTPISTIRPYINNVSSFLMGNSPDLPVRPSKSSSLSSKIIRPKGFANGGIVGLNGGAAVAPDARDLRVTNSARQGLIESLSELDNEGALTRRMYAAIAGGQSFGLYSPGYQNTFLASSINPLTGLVEGVTAEALFGGHWSSPPETTVIDSLFATRGASHLLGQALMAVAYPGLEAGHTIVPTGNLSTYSSKLAQRLQKAGLVPYSQTAAYGQTNVIGRSDAITQVQQEFGTRLLSMNNTQDRILDADKLNQLGQLFRAVLHGDISLDSELGRIINEVINRDYLMGAAKSRFNLGSFGHISQRDADALVKESIKSGPLSKPISLEPPIMKSGGGIVDKIGIGPAEKWQDTLELAKAFGINYLTNEQTLTFNRLREMLANSLQFAGQFGTGELSNKHMLDVYGTGDYYQESMKGRSPALLRLYYSILTEGGFGMGSTSQSLFNRGMTYISGIDKASGLFNGVKSNIYKTDTSDLLLESLASTPAASHAVLAALTSAKLQAESSSLKLFPSKSLSAFSNPIVERATKLGLISQSRGTTEHNPIGRSWGLEQVQKSILQSFLLEQLAGYPYIDKSFSPIGHSDILNFNQIGKGMLRGNVPELGNATQLLDARDPETIARFQRLLNPRAYPSPEEMLNVIKQETGLFNYVPTSLHQTMRDLSAEARSTVPRPRPRFANGGIARFSNGGIDINPDELKLDTWQLGSMYDKILKLRKYLVHGAEYGADAGLMFGREGAMAQQALRMYWSLLTEGGFGSSISPSSIGTQPMDVKFFSGINKKYGTIEGIQSSIGRKEDIIDGIFHEMISLSSTPLASHLVPAVLGAAKLGANAEGAGLYASDSLSAQSAPMAAKALRLGLIENNPQNPDYSSTNQLNRGYAYDNAYHEFFYAVNRLFGMDPHYLGMYGFAQEGNLLELNAIAKAMLRGTDFSKRESYEILRDVFNTDASKQRARRLIDPTQYPDPQQMLADIHNQTGLFRIFEPGTTSIEPVETFKQIDSAPAGFTGRVPGLNKRNPFFEFRADGGSIHGPGGPKDDRIPAYLSNGEYVVNAASVKKYGLGTLDAINAGKFARGGIIGFAGGGLSGGAVEGVLAGQMGLGSVMGQGSGRVFATPDQKALMDQQFRLMTEQQTLLKQELAQTKKFTKIRATMTNMYQKMMTPSDHSAGMGKGFALQMVMPLLSEAIGKTSWGQKRENQAYTQGISWSGTGAMMAAFMGKGTPAMIAAGVAAGALGIAVGKYQEHAEKARNATLGLNSALVPSAEVLDMFGVKMRDFSKVGLIATQQMQVSQSNIETIASSLKQSQDPTTQGAVQDLADAVASGDMKKVKSLSMQRYTTLSGSLGEQNAKDVTLGYLKAAGLSGISLDNMAKGFGKQTSQEKIQSIFSSLDTAKWKQYADAKSRSEDKSLTAAQRKASTDTLVGMGLDLAPDAKTIANYAKGLSESGSLTDIESLMTQLKDPKNSTMLTAFNTSWSQFDKILKETNPDLANTDEQLNALNVPMVDIVRLNGLIGTGFQTTASQAAALAKTVDGVVAAEKWQSLKQKASSIFSSMFGSPNAGATGGGNPGAGIQKKIDALQKEQKAIKDNMDARQKAYDLGQQEIQQQQALADLRDNAARAASSGDLIAMAEAQSKYNAEMAKQNELKDKQAADDADQAKIDALQDKIDALQKKLNSLSGASTAASTATDKLTSSQEKVNAAITNAIDSGNWTDWQSLLSQIQTNLGGKQGANQALKDAGINIDVLTGKVKEFMKTQEGHDAGLANSILKNLNVTLGNTQIKQLATGMLMSWIEKNPDKASKNPGAVAAELQKFINALEPIFGRSANSANAREDRGGVSGSANGGFVTAKAYGGYISGPGGPREDLIPAMLSNGEYVVTAGAVSKYGLSFMNALNAGQIGQPTFATGGLAPSYRFGLGSGDSTAVNNNPVYNISVNVAGSNATADEIARAVMKTLERKEKTMTTGRRLG